MIKINKYKLCKEFESSKSDILDEIYFFLTRSEGYKDIKEDINLEMFNYIEPLRKELSDILLKEWGEDGEKTVAEILNAKRMSGNSSKDVEFFRLKALYLGSQKRECIDIFTPESLIIPTNYGNYHHFNNLPNDKNNFKEVVDSKERYAIKDLWCKLLIKYFPTNIKIDKNILLDKFKVEGLNSTKSINFILTMSEGYEDVKQDIELELNAYLQPLKEELNNILLKEWGDKGKELTTFEGQESFQDVEYWRLKALYLGSQKKVNIEIFNIDSRIISSAYANYHYFDNLKQHMTDLEKKSKLFKLNHESLSKAQDIEGRKLEALWNKLLIKYFD